MNVLADERLLTIGREGVEVAHEALIKHWPTLRRWLDEDRGGLRTHRRLAEAAEEWERLGRDDGAVYRGSRLVEAVAWLQQRSASANERERAFVAASLAVEHRDRRRRYARLALVCTLFLVGLVAATVALVTLRQRAAERNIAESRAIAAEADIELSLDPQLGLLLAIQAAEKAHTAEATDALRHALLLLHGQLTLHNPPTR